MTKFIVVFFSIQIALISQAPSAEAQQDSVVVDSTAAKKSETYAETSPIPENAKKEGSGEFTKITYSTANVPHLDWIEVVMKDGKIHKIPANRWHTFYEYERHWELRPFPHWVTTAIVYEYSECHLDSSPNPSPPDRDSNGNVVRKPPVLRQYYSGIRNIVLNVVAKEIRETWYVSTTPAGDAIRTKIHPRFES